VVAAETDTEKSRVNCLSVSQEMRKQSHCEATDSSAAIQLLGGRSGLDLGVSPCVDSHREAQWSLECRKFGNETV
jgi:hypothetical protein